MALNTKQVLEALKEALVQIEKDNQHGKRREESIREAIALCEQDLKEGREYGGGN